MSRGFVSGIVPGIVLILIPDASASERRTQFSSFERARDYHTGLAAVQALNHTTRLASPTAACGDSSLEPVEKDPAVYAYSCEIEEIDPPGDKPLSEKLDTKKPASSRPVKPQFRQVTWYTDNDNVLMGLVPSGDDTGFTYRMGLGYLEP
ncbi:MAG: hypothetical protein EOP09_04180, partial [Proteobacteria bacterium]